MLQSLHIRNYAIIDEIRVDFSKGLNIITGETGAGKSILLGALSLVLGNRADSNVLYNKDKKCVVEAVFNIKDFKLRAFFEENELDYDAEACLRREIATSGKSRAFINDTPVTLHVLKALVEQLIHLHQQDDTLALNSRAFQYLILDKMCGHENLFNQYVQLYKSFKQDQKQLSKLIENQLKVKNDREFLEYQLEELNRLPLNNLDQQQLEAELDQQNNLEEIKALSYQIEQMIIDADQSVINVLHQANGLVSKLTSLLPSIEKQGQRILSSIEELKDSVNEVSNLTSSLDLDQELVQKNTDTLDLLYRLQSKHQVNTVEELGLKRDEIENKLSVNAGMEEEIKKIEHRLSTNSIKLKELALNLHNNRIHYAKELKTRLEKLLQQMGMEDASVRIDLALATELDQYGSSSIQFLFSANKGFEEKPIAQIASGGERSRFMLAIKYLLAGKTNLATMLFDEIDSGVSGEIAQKIGDLLKHISKSHQLICITHLPQIAAKAHRHFLVYKRSSDQRTNTYLRALKEDEQVQEIAKMLSGEQVTDAALSNAKELMH